MCRPFCSFAWCTAPAKTISHLSLCAPSQTPAAVVAGIAAGILHENPDANAGAVLKSRAQLLDSQDQEGNRRLLANIATQACDPSKVTYHAANQDTITKDNAQSAGLRLAGMGPDFPIQRKRKGGVRSTLARNKRPLRQGYSAADERLLLSTLSLPITVDTNCKSHSDCDGESKCKGHWNLGKECRTKKEDCKQFGTRYGTRKNDWGCSGTKRCVAANNIKWGTCME